MSLRPIVLWPDPRLSEPCAPVGEITDEIRRLAGDMLETMYAAPGRGLAAPQVGVLLRLFVMDTAWKTGTRDPVVMINPDILDASATLCAGEEGCLSIPGVPAEVERPETVTLRWTGLDGSITVRRLGGIAARCALHEYDHLDGVLILDRIAAEARAALAPALARLEGTA